MSSASEPYWLGRTSSEQDRLLKQHAIWTKSIGYLLHPSIPPTLPPNARIADIATGTGIWLCDLASASPPTHTFHGFDISSSQFLPAASLAPNVSLGHMDFRAPMPAALQGTFDVVNVRLVVISMGALAVWQEMMRNLVTLLKPGGVLTWTEGNFLGARAFRGGGAGAAQGLALTAGQVMLNDTLRRRFGFSFPDFAELFRGAGLGGVQEDVVSTDRLVEQRREVTEIGVGAVFGGLKNLSTVAEEGYWDETEVVRRRKEAVEEMEGGAYLRWDIHVGIGRRET